MEAHASCPIPWKIKKYKFKKCSVSFSQQPDLIITSRYIWPITLIFFFFHLWPESKRHSFPTCFFYFYLNTAEVFQGSSCSYLLSHVISFDSPVKHIFTKARETTVAIKSLHILAWFRLLVIQKSPRAHSRPRLAAPTSTSFLVQPLCSQAWQGQHSLIRFFRNRLTVFS